METNTSALTRQENESVSPAILEQVLAGGDLSKLTPRQRMEYLNAVCRSVGLNPLTRPIEFIALNGRLVPYAKKDCTDQLRSIRRISITIVSRELEDGIYTVTARATTPDGRTDEDVGSVVIGNLKGDALANAKMKAHTKAKRRVTLSVCGLGILDESEFDTVRAAHPVSLPAPTPTTLAEDAELVTPEAETDDEKIERWRVAITSTTDLAALEQLGKELRQEVKTEHVRLTLSPVYVERKKALKAGAAANEAA